MHDLIVHDYGPGRQMISLHAEVAAEGNLLAIHDVIDNVENELRTQLGCDATIHMDPIVTADEHVRELRETVTELIGEIDPVISMHDFRVVMGQTHTNLIFDLLVPFRFSIRDEALMQLVQERIRERLGENYFVVTKVDKAFVK